MHSLEKLLESPHPFLNRVFSSLDEDDIDISSYELDHICYRVETNERYDELREKLLEVGILLTEAQIGGRAISSFKLDKPIIYRNREICCVELPAPKPKRSYVEGYEHVEFVIDVSFEEFMAAHPKISFDMGASTKEINPDITIDYDGFVVKFHHNTLEYVIKNLQ